jgi:hypothetical protein
VSRKKESQYVGVLSYSMPGVLYVYFVEDVYFYKSRMDSQVTPCEDDLYRDPDLSASGGLFH